MRRPSTRNARQQRAQQKRRSQDQERSNAHCRSATRTQAALNDKPADASSPPPGSVRPQARGALAQPASGHAESPRPPGTGVTSWSATATVATKNPHEEYEALARPGGVEKFADWLHNVYIPNAFRAHAERLPAVLRPVRAPRGPRRRRLRTSRANARAPDDSEPAPEPVAIPLSRFRRDISAWLEAGGRVNCPTGKILEEP